MASPAARPVRSKDKVLPVALRAAPSRALFLPATFSSLKEYWPLFRMLMSSLALLEAEPFRKIVPKLTPSEPLPVPLKVAFTFDPAFISSVPIVADNFKALVSGLGLERVNSCSPEPLKTNVPTSMVAVTIPGILMFVVFRTLTPFAPVTRIRSPSLLSQIMQKAPCLRINRPN